MLLDWENGTLLDHHLAGIAPESYWLILVLKWNYVRTEHLGRRLLVCSTKGLEILPGVYKELLGV